MLRRLVEANLQKDPQPMLEVKGLLLELREAWQQAALQCQGGGQIAQGLNIKG